MLSMHRIAQSPDDNAIMHEIGIGGKRRRDSAGEVDNRFSWGPFTLLDRIAVHCRLIATEQHRVQHGTHVSGGSFSTVVTRKLR